MTIEQHRQFWQLLADELNVKEIQMSTPIYLNGKQLSVLFQAKDFANPTAEFWYKVEEKKMPCESKKSFLPIMNNLYKSYKDSQEERS